MLVLDSMLSSVCFCYSKAGGGQLESRCYFGHHTYSIIVVALFIYIYIYIYINY